MHCENALVQKVHDSISQEENLIEVYKNKVFCVKSFGVRISR